MDIVIRNASLLPNPGSGDPPYPGCVHIRGQEIAYVGTQKEPDFPPERTIDADGALVMPGFYDLHTHVAMNILRGYADDLPLQTWLTEDIFPAEAKFTDDMVYWASMGAMCELARAGIVCIADMYDHCDAIARAVSESGMRAVLSRGIVSRGNESWRAKLDEAEELYLNWNGAGRISVWFSPHGQYTNTPQSVAAIGELARKYGTGVHTHVSETKKEHDACIAETGLSPVEFFAREGLMEGPFVGAHCVWVADRDMDIMAEHGAGCAACARSNLKLASGFARLVQMEKRGVPVALGTDGAASNNRLSIMSEMEMASYVQKTIEGDPSVMSAPHMLEMACTTGPKILRQNGGRLEEGLNADIIMLRTDGWRWNPGYNVHSSLVYAAQDPDVAMTIVGGDILFENGRCTFADENEVKDRLKGYAREFDR